MTSIEWLKEKLWNEFNFSFSDNIFEQAKEMHKQEIIDAYEASEMNENEIRYKIVDGERYYSFDNAEDYYNETYKNQQ